MCNPAAPECQQTRCKLQSQAKACNRDCSRRRSACHMGSVLHRIEVSAARRHCSTDTYAMNAQQRSVPTSQTRRIDRASTRVHNTVHVLALTEIARSSFAAAGRAQRLLASSRENAMARLAGACRHASAASALPADAAASAWHMESVRHRNEVSAARWRCSMDTYAMNAQKRSVPTSQTRLNDRASIQVHTTCHDAALTGISRSSFAAAARAQGLLCARCASSAMASQPRCFAVDRLTPHHVLRVDAVLCTQCDRQGQASCQASRATRCAAARSTHISQQATTRSRLQSRHPGYSCRPALHRGLRESLRALAQSGVGATTSRPGMAPRPRFGPGSLQP